MFILRKIFNTFYYCFNNIFKLDNLNKNLDNKLNNILYINSYKFNKINIKSSVWLNIIFRLILLILILWFISNNLNQYVLYKEIVNAINNLISWFLALLKIDYNYFFNKVTKNDFNSLLSLDSFIARIHLSFTSIDFIYSVYSPINDNIDLLLIELQCYLYNIIEFIQSLKFDEATFIKLFSFKFLRYSYIQFYFRTYFNFEIVNNIPFFFLFNLLFLLTTIFSLISLSYLGLYGVFVLNFISIFLFWLVLSYYFYLIFFKQIFFYINLFDWMYLTQNHKISFDIIFDTTSLSFLYLTISIGLFVYIYAFSYFRYEPSVDRLILYLNLFMLSMNLLVISGNFICILLGWELIGLTSFFLINFWVNRIGTFKAAFKAYSFNKISDVFLLISILMIFNITNSVDILTFCNSIYLYETYSIKLFNSYLNIIDIISLTFIICISIKSAQIIGHLWLPDSMEAPVPASALIHSATLVSAGIYLLIRLSPLFELSYIALNILPILGTLTAFYGAITASFQSDTKKTLAYSTISHCGFLVLLYSTGVIEFVVLYLYVHGFFKAATFLCVGNVNRFNKNNQDYKCMGLFFKYLPFESFSIFVCLINLSSLPLSIGFYIKHLLFLSFKDNIILYKILFNILIFSGILSIFYSGRLYYNIFFDIKKSKKKIYNNLKVLNSIYFSNNSLASNFAIIGLIIISYSIILILYSLTISDYIKISDTSVNNFNNSYNYYYYNIINNLLNISILNWIIILLVFFFIFINWRFSFSFENNINNMFISIFIFFFIYLLI